jgi:hypothetical protein
MMEREANVLAGEILDALLDARRADADAALIEALDLLTERTGQNKYRHAASIMRGTKLGRHEIDDRAALRRIRGFPPEQRHKAASVVAGQIAGAGASEQRVEAIANRLRRKLRKKAVEIVITAAIA